MAKKTEEQKKPQESSLKNLGMHLEHAPAPKPEELQGKIVKFDPTKKFGFIEVRKGYRLYFRLANVKNGIPQEGMVVKFQIGKGQGKDDDDIAVNIVLPENAASAAVPNGTPAVSSDWQIPYDTNKALPQENKPDNFALTLNRFITWQAEQKERGKLSIPNDFLKNLTSSMSGSVKTQLQQVKKRHAQMIEAIKVMHLVDNSFSASLTWRMVVGLGNESVHETSMTLHHVYGIPYIPGSALKGIARDMAIAELCEELGNNERPDVLDKLFDASFIELEKLDTPQKKRDYVKSNGTVFCENEEYAPQDATIDKILGGWPRFRTAQQVLGSQGQAGKIIFFDTFPEESVKMTPDIMNPHYPKYYGEKQPPSDWQNPIPVSFLTLENAKFTFALAAKRKNEEPSSQELLNAAVSWLKQGVTEHGIGAKTAVGYGYFTEQTR